MCKNRRLEEERVTPIEARSPVKIIELLLKIEHLVTSKSRAVGNSKLGYHLQTESLSAQNYFADFARCDKSGLRRSHDHMPRSDGLCYAVHVTILVLVVNSHRFQLLRSYMFLLWPPVLMCS